MAEQLVVVESPAKARTLKKYLGPDFQILASYGHVRDLLPKDGAVQPDHGFAMKYELIEKNSKHVDAIARAMKRADVLYLATDPDREGEAISWHIYELLRAKRLLQGKSVRRIVFHEVTRRAIESAVDHPRELSMDLVNAQQARRALDYLVGFNLSPLLWKKVRRGLSAGRVQSPALRMIVEREEEIQKFVRREYWTIEAEAEKDGRQFAAKLTQYRGEKVEQFSITQQEDADAAVRALTAEAHGRLQVSCVEKKRRKRNPAPPFTTSTLQQEAARKLGFSAQRTMRVAQQLYEGIDIGGDRVGLITYMRTDSVSLANEALQDIRRYVGERYGSSALPPQPRIYKTKSKNAQEAHEAVRPTSAHRDPRALKPHLSAEQLKLYDLVWRRAIACQMAHATIDTVSVDLSCGEGNLFRATGSTVVDPGFMAVYEEGRDEAKEGEDGPALPPMVEGEQVALRDLQGHQHFTEPPPRYTEASLIKALEEHGIGRPSTYAAIISTLLQREYAVLEKKRFRPTDVGSIVNRFLTQHFAPYVDYQFTARLEDELDAVSRGEEQWVPLLQRFWTPFKSRVDAKAESVTRRDVTHESLEERCPKCDRPLSIRLGRHGRFVGCTGFPECDYTRNLEEDRGAAPEPELVEGRQCPKCGGALHVKRGRYGRFIGCSNYPQCKYIEPLEKPSDTGVSCPECGRGTLLKRRSRNGKVFYSCSTYPSCKYAVWNEPVPRPCPSCKWPILTLKVTKRRGSALVCPRKECGYTEPQGVVRVAAAS